jgi:hypothetical protein
MECFYRLVPQAGLFFFSVAPTLSELDARFRKLFAMKSQIVGFSPDSFLAGIATASSPAFGHKKISPFFRTRVYIFLVPQAGLEPALQRKRILSPPRLPFRHQGIKNCADEVYGKVSNIQIDFFKSLFTLFVWNLS